MATLKTIVIQGDSTSHAKAKQKNYNHEYGKISDELKQELKDCLALLEKFKFEYIYHHEDLIQQLKAHAPDLIFNLCDEGFNNQAHQELHIPAILDMLDIPYTGAGPTCLALCYNKSLICLLANSLNIPIPDQYYYTNESQPCFFDKFPAIIKPNFGDGSSGITQQAVVHDNQALNEHIHRLKKELSNAPLLIQQYLQGTEFSVGLIGNPGKFEVLPIIEMDYTELPAHLPKILGAEYKWDPTSPYWKQIKFKEAQLKANTKTQLIDYSCVLFERLHCQDYARFDFRADVDGNIKLLEINPNPGLDLLGLMADMNEMPYEKMLEKILSAARNRYNL